MPHSLLMFFFPDSTAFLIAENHFFHHAGRILPDDFIESLKIDYFVLEEFVLLPKGLILLLQILCTHFPWHYFFRDNLYACCGLGCALPPTENIVLCKNLVSVAADVIGCGMRYSKNSGRLPDCLALFSIDNDFHLFLNHEMFPHLFFSFRYHLQELRNILCYLNGRGANQDTAKSKNVSLSHQISL